ncbi:MAG TPA: amidohydrolase family protein [Allosphingosinicella sp.]|jgi:imidazolonepropionase-like amidohydrolase
MLCRFFVALAFFFAAGAAAAQAPVTAIVGADLLPMTATERLRDQTVILRGDRIVAVGPRGRTPIPRGARRIEARGMMLMPGLVDMHVHLAPATGEPGDAAQRALAVMLAHGTTTARGMAGSPNNLAVRGRIERGELIGPRLYAASPGLHVNNTASPDAARQAVRAARTAGYDLIKSHHLPDAAIWQAVQDEARTQRLPVAGHVANQVGLARAMEAGQQIEHLDGTLLALLPSGAPERQIDFAQIPPPEVLAALARTGDAEIAALARQARAARSWHVPTLALFEKIADIDADVAALRARPEMRYVPEPVLAQWAQQATGLRDAGFTAEQGRAFRELRRRIVRAFHAAGVPMMAGSDTAQRFHLWGPGLIDEIEALHAAGLSRLDALRSATVVPRDYFRSLPNGGSSLGWRADFGTIEPGARADLILLRGDPTRDLSLLRRPETVIAAGRVHDRAALDHLLEAAAAAARSVQ